jgi:hypothetical protein
VLALTALELAPVQVLASAPVSSAVVVSSASTWAVLAAEAAKPLVELLVVRPPVLVHLLLPQLPLRTADATNLFKKLPQGGALLRLFLW